MRQSNKSTTPLLQKAIIIRELNRTLEARPRIQKVNQFWSKERLGTFFLKDAQKLVNSARRTGGLSLKEK